VKNPDVQLNLFIYDERAVISFDSSGEPLHKRKYRVHTGAAPLQESLAAALLRIARYDAQEITIDPCCGSGTLLIEAALMASNTPPGSWRTRWGFQAHPDFNFDAWLRVKNQADGQIKALKPGSFFGLEREPEIAEFCRANIENAGLADAIEIKCTNFSTYTPEASYTFLISNPPHGKRLGSEDGLKPVYRALGDFMKQKMAKPSRGFLYTSSSMLAKEVGLAAKRRHVINCGGVDARLLQFDIY
jgi:putative N6-adenine-specific DNA methylase